MEEVAKPEEENEAVVLEFYEVNLLLIDPSSRLKRRITKVVHFYKV